MPASFAAGTSVRFTRTFSEFPASEGWSYALFIRGVGALDAQGEADGDSFDVAIPATGEGGTDSLEPGTYRWTERLTSDEEDPQVVDVASGSVTVLPNIATAAAGDLRSRDEQELAIINAAVSGQLTGGMASYQISGRMVQNIPLADLLKMRATLEARIARKRAGGSPLGSIGVRFVDA